MAETLSELEARRRELFQELEALGDFRPGMISTNYRKCGKQNCACAQPGHQGHGPQYLWNTTQNNRSRAQVIRLGPELEKVERELAKYRRFGELCSELVAVNEQLCRLRPVAEISDERELSRLKKNLAAEVQQEVAQELERLLGRLLRPAGSLDLEASELAIRAAMHEVGGVLLAKLLSSDPGGSGAGVKCSAGHAATFVDYRSKEITTVVGPVEFRRAYYHCDGCGEGVLPQDQALDLVGTSFSPGVRRLMGRVGGKESFNEGRLDLEELAGYCQLNSRSNNQVATPAI